MTKRPSWDEIWLTVAVAVSARSTCPRAAVGAAVVTTDNRLVGTGYNGAPHGQPHCFDVGCEPDLTGSCRRVVHAELNALLQAGLDRARGGTLYSTVEPCPSCAAAIANVGLRRVVFLRPYRPLPGVRRGSQILAEAGVFVEHWRKKDENIQHDEFTATDPVHHG